MNFYTLSQSGFHVNIYVCIGGGHEYVCVFIFNNVYAQCNKAKTKIKDF